MYTRYSHQFTNSLSEVKQKHKAHIHCWGNKLGIFSRKGLQRKLHRWLGNGKMSHSGGLWPQDRYRTKLARNTQRKNQLLRNKYYLQGHTFSDYFWDISALLLKLKAKCSDLEQPSPACGCPKTEHTFGCCSFRVTYSKSTIIT